MKTEPPVVRTLTIEGVPVHQFGDNYTFPVVWLPQNSESEHFPPATAEEFDRRAVPTLITVRVMGLAAHLFNRMEQRLVRRGAGGPPDARVLLLTDRVTPGLFMVSERFINAIAEQAGFRLWVRGKGGRG